MAHLGPAIFSPSVARIAASTAKDWKFVDDWLASKFGARSQPVFERNPDTLQALLALASVNEVADEEKNVVARADALATRELQSHHSNATAKQAPLKSELLSVLHEWLPRDACSTLCALATLAAELGVVHPTPESLSHVLADFRAEELDVDMMRERLQSTLACLDHEHAQADKLLEALRNWAYTPSHDLARNNIELNRSMKALSVRMPDLGGPSTNSPRARRPRHPTINEVATEESAYLHLLAQKKDLDSRLADFSGISTDANAARSNLDRLRTRLGTTVRQRDVVFEGLVERETPHKRR
ncbi:hypothetical protein F5X68DRAFT_263566 [Plectosphaerella plurivora]|uniref:Uncharacterized protein n=1 Tax=Plectosphaerella plurivora TaxID=936078 RepID=A0A9P8V8U3_9PEZI|nr:hypothetical protein F5X68DRAFT_263566 [Plectosphaerella plurivora]